MKLHVDQIKARRALISFLLSDEKEMVLNGFAGSGKSTVISSILSITEKELRTAALLTKLPFKQYSYVFAAMSNKACAALQEQFQSEDITIRTVHKCFGLKIQNDWSTGKKVLATTNAGPVFSSNSAIFVDEAYFLNSELLSVIRLMLPNSCKIIYVGDADQLLPIEGKQVNFKTLQHNVTLDTIKRHAGSILKNATNFRKAIHSEIIPEIIYDNSVKLLEPKECFSKLVESFRKGENTKFIGFTNDIVKRTNHSIQQILSPKSFFEVGDLVTVNDSYPPFHADYSGRIESISKSYKKLDISGADVAIDGKSIFVPYDPYIKAKKMGQYSKRKAWSDFFDVSDGIGDLRYGYACTVHKSQGSTYDNVFISLSDIGKCRTKDMLARLMYVAISRARNNVYLVGNLPAKN